MGRHEEGLLAADEYKGMEKAGKEGETHLEANY
jgi:hypothetical protein